MTPARSPRDELPSLCRLSAPHLKGLGPHREHSSTAESGFIGPSSLTLVPLNEDNITRTAPFNFAGDLTVTFEAQCRTSTTGSNTVTVYLELVNLDTSPETITVLEPTRLFSSSGQLCYRVNTFEASRHSITGIARGLPRANYAVQVRAAGSGFGGDLLNYTLIVRP